MSQKSTYRIVKDLTSQYVKTYATRENLIKALDNMGLVDARIRVIKTTDKERWTAIFLGQDQMDNWHRSNHSFNIVG